jgi:Gpi18-like mannosyltransferase
MKKKNSKFLLGAFLTWRTLLFVFVILAVLIVPVQEGFLGGGLLYEKFPYFWGWINFDGEHFLALPYEGYRPLTYFYFPFYPLLTWLVAQFTGGGFLSLASSGLIVSNASFLVALFGLWKLLGMDKKKNIRNIVILLLLVFPTSFYFGSFYTESLFLALVVWSFYLARKKRWILAGVLGAFAGATRLVGLALIPALFIEMLLQRKESGKQNLSKPIAGLLIVPLGILAYMYFLKVKTGDPLEFFHAVGIFGQQRSTQMVLLPQVFYRYFVKILPNINYLYFPIVFVTYLEIITALVFLGLVVASFFKLRASYAIYFAVGYLIPTLSGSFSSLPRYVLVLFPAFILLADYISKKSKVLQFFVFSILFICLIIATSLFIRGYWVS